MWEFDVDPVEMILTVADLVLRLDSGVLNTQSSPVPFWQFLETRIVDIITGEVVDEFSVELAIPLKGDQVTETCLRAELRDGLLLCPQPDGRLTTIVVEGGRSTDRRRRGGRHSHVCPLSAHSQRRRLPHSPVLGRGFDTGRECSGWGAVAGAVDVDGPSPPGLPEALRNHFG